MAVNTRSKSESSNAEIKLRHIYLESTRIKHPKINYVYHIKNKSLPNGEAIITFMGNIYNVTNLDVSTFCYQTKGPIETQHFRFLCANDSSLFIYKNSLPISVLKNHMPPIFYYSQNQPTHLQAIHEMQIKLDEAKYDNHFELQMIKSTTIKNIKICNVELQEECQTLAGKVPVYSGKYPLFVEDKRPSYQVLESLYNKFVNYNDNARLAEQNENSREWCTIRAHFVTTLLNQYGITSIKIFKKWNVSDWKKIHPNHTVALGFHCATMIIDSENRKWVWDPWFYMNKKLLTLPQWLYRSEEPIPIKMLVANSTIIFDHVSGSNSRSEFLMDHDFERYLFKTFQMLWSSAVPNPPEKFIQVKIKQEKINSFRFYYQKMLMDFFRTLMKRKKRSCLKFWRSQSRLH